MKRVEQESWFWVIQWRQSKDPRKTTRTRSHALWEWQIGALDSRPQFRDRIKNLFHCRHCVVSRESDREDKARMMMMKDRNKETKREKEFPWLARETHGWRKSPQFTNTFSAAWIDLIFIGWCSVPEGCFPFDCPFSLTPGTYIHVQLCHRSCPIECVPAHVALVCTRTLHHAPLARV